MLCWYYNNNPLLAVVFVLTLVYSDTDKGILLEALFLIAGALLNMQIHLFNHIVRIILMWSLGITFIKAMSI